MKGRTARDLNYFATVCSLGPSVGCLPRMAQFGWTIYIGYIGFSIGRTFVDFVGKKKQQSDSCLLLDRQLAAAGSLGLSPRV